MSLRCYKVCKQKEPPDGGYSWVILAAGVGVAFHCGCSFSTLGIYLVELEEYFNTNMSSLSWIGALKFFVMGVGALLGSPPIKVFGFRAISAFGCLLVSGGYALSTLAYSVPYLYCTYGLMTGLGYGMYSMVTPVVLQHYFVRLRARAMGIFFAGVALGAFIWPPMVEAMISKYTWRGAILIQGSIHLNCLVLTGLLRPPPSYAKPQLKQTQLEEMNKIKENEASSQSGDKEETHNGEEEKQETESIVKLPVTQPRKKSPVVKIFTDLAAGYANLVSASPLKNTPFRFHVVGHFLIQIGHFGVQSFMPLRAVGMGYSKSMAAMLPSLVGISSLVGRILAGFIGDRFPKHRPGISGCAALLGGTLTAISASFPTYAPVAVYAVVYGLVASVYVALLFVIIGDFLPLSEMGHATGVLMLAIGFANLVGFPLTGKMIDVTGNPAYSFLLFGGTIILGGLCHGLAQWFYNKQRHYGYKKASTEMPDIHI